MCGTEANEERQEVLASLPLAERLEVLEAGNFWGHIESSEVDEESLTFAELERYRGIVNEDTEEGEQDPIDSKTMINEDAFNAPLWPESDNQRESVVNLGSAITSLLNWQQDHEVNERAFDNVLYIMKGMLPPTSCLPVTRKTCISIIRADGAHEFERHWCKPSSNGEGCGQYCYPHIEGAHLQSVRRELNDAPTSGITFCPECKVCIAIILLDFLNLLFT